jgi:ABC-type transport system involved in multi-copper enzyme maturation permease subunit
MTAPLPTAGAQEVRQPLRPSFLGALRGIWLFTWKPQLSWQRVPQGVLLLLALPVLAYLTTLPLQRESRRPRLPSDPQASLGRFAAQLRRPGMRWVPDKRSEVLSIFQEEFESAENRLRAGQALESSVERQKEEIRLCFERIERRLQPVLNEDQFRAFRRFELQEVQFRQQEARVLGWNPTTPYFRLLIDLYFFVIVPLQCVKASGGVIRDELQADTLGFLVTRPVSRARLLVLKYLTQTAWLQLVLLLQTLLLFAVGHLRHVPALLSLLPLFLAAQFLAVLAWGALGVFLGQVAKRYMGVALIYGFIVELGIGSIPTNINTLSVMRHLKTLLSHNPTLQGLYEWTATGLPLAIGALALATVLFVALAALLFTFREYHHTAEMQK